MLCIVCQSGGGEIDSMGGGRRFHCDGCGGYYRISDTLDAILGDKVFDIERTRTALDQRRAWLRDHPRGEGRDQDFEPILNSTDTDLLIDP